MTAIALALAASMAWGVGDFLGGVSSRRVSTLTVLAVSEVAGLVLLAILVAGSGDDPLGAGGTAAAVAAGVAGLVGLGGLYRGMAVGAIGVVAPVSTLSAVMPLAYGLARGERPGGWQLAGAIVILAGVALVAREPGNSGGRFAAGLGFALLAAVGFGLYFVFIDAASEGSAPWAVFLSRGTASAIAVTLVLRRGAMRAPVRLLPTLTAIGLFDAGANGLLAAALNRGYTSIVAVLASLYPVVTIMLAATVLRERIAPLRALGIAAALAGVGLVSAG